MDIAIIDDDATDRQKAASLLQDYIRKNHDKLLPSLRLTFFDSAEALLDGFIPGHFSLLLLDIYMQKITGMAAAKKIREQDADCSLIFLTTSTDHLLDGYTVFADGYILKPIASHSIDFYRVLEHCMPRLLAQQNTLDFLADGCPFHIPYDKLLYADCNYNRTVTLHMAQRTIQTTDSYADIQQKLSIDSRFLECYHRVNMDYIDAMDEESFLLTNQEHLPISRRKKNQVKEQYALYLLEK